MFRSLLGKGIARPDPLGLGLEVDERARVISGAGIADPLLRVAGPLARFHFGEVMGLPEISGHARFVAETLVADLDMLKGRAHSAIWISGGELLATRRTAWCAFSVFERIGGPGRTRTCNQIVMSDRL